MCISQNVCTSTRDGISLSGFYVVRCLTLRLGLKRSATKRRTVCACVSDAYLVGCVRCAYMGHMRHSASYVCTCVFRMWVWGLYGSLYMLGLLERWRWCLRLGRWTKWTIHKQRDVDIAVCNRHWPANCKQIIMSIPKYTDAVSLWLFFILCRNLFYLKILENVI